MVDNSEATTVTSVKPGQEVPTLAAALEVHLGLGDVLRDQGDLAGAKKELRAALAITKASTDPALHARAAALQRQLEK